MKDINDSDDNKNISAIRIAPHVQSVLIENSYPEEKNACKAGYLFKIIVCSSELRSMTYEGPPARHPEPKP